MRAWAPLALVVMVGCSCGEPHTEVRWPASADVPLRDELAVTAHAEGADEVLLPTGERVEPEPLPQDAPGIRARSFVHDGLWVAEVVLGHVADESTPLPLVLMLHGRGDRPRIPGGPLGRVPTPMRVLVPRGPLALGSGFAWARHSVTQSRHHDAIAADLVSIADRLTALLAHVIETRPTAGTPIVTGFSQGAMLAWILALRHPDRVGLAIPIAGWVPDGARPQELRAAPTHAMHGTEDPVVRIAPTREWIATLEAAGNVVRWREFEGAGHDVTSEMNELFEMWLEEALHERAPELRGGLGDPGIDPAPVEPHEPPVESIDLTEEAVPAAPPPDVD